MIRIVVPFNSRKQLGTCSRAGILELLGLNGTDDGDDYYEYDDY